MSARDFVAQAVAPDWSAIQWRAASISIIAVSLCLAGGLVFGSAPAGMAAATGALSVGFGAFQRISKIPGLPMLLAAFGMSVCATLCVALAHSVLLAIVAGGVIAAACGLATSFGQAPWWFTLQWAIAFFVATATPAGWESALERGGLVLAGGLLQAAIVLTSWRWRPFGAGDRPCLPGLGELRSTLRGAGAVGQALGSGPEARYALVSGAMTSLGILIEISVHLANGYWVPMTALIILKPQSRDTAARSLQRILGALVGGGVATLMAAVIRPGGVALALTVIALAWCTYALQRVNYAVFSVGITATVVFLLALTGLPEPETALRRVVATLIGAALALLAGALLRQRQPAERLTSGSAPRPR